MRDGTNMQSIFFLFFRLKLFKQFKNYTRKFLVYLRKHECKIRLGDKNLSKI